jgi:hypothetical protein
MASGVSIVYALRIKDEPRRHDIRLSRPITGRGAPPICRRHLRQLPIRYRWRTALTMIHHISNGVRRLPIAPDRLPIVLRGEGRHATIATFRREVHVPC